MQSVKIPRKSTDFDMTPFVDVAFLILSFFMLATKFKPPEKVPVKTPSSVSADKLKDQDALQVSFDSSGRVFFTMTVLHNQNYGFIREMLDEVDKAKALGLSEAEKQAFMKNPIAGAPFKDLKAVLSGARVLETGIPVDSANNELQMWVQAGNDVFRNHINQGMTLTPNYMI